MDGLPMEYPMVVKASPADEPCGCVLPLANSETITPTALAGRAARDPEARVKTRIKATKVAAASFLYMSYPP